MLTLQPDPPFVLKPSRRSDFERACPGPHDTSGAGRADARGLDCIGLETALFHKVLPMEPAGAVTPVACSSVAEFEKLEPALRDRLGPVVCRLKSAKAIEDEILSMRAAYLSRRAEMRTPSRDSCRDWSGSRTGWIALAVLCLAVTVSVLWPGLAIAAVTVWAALTLLSVTGLRTLGALVEFRHARKHGRLWTSQRPFHLPADQMPMMSLLVPLYDETDIAERLVKRLGRLDYPSDRLEACLILEANDTKTHAALRGARLPRWMRIIEVPTGTLQTKPRAMNYALDFTKGDIIGIYDAEDRPAPDQLMKIAGAFANASPDVACLQGVLDFYNPRQSWLTRCFTIDYATWFRLVLPGLERLGMVIPLGGTTVFFRRRALEDLGRWDAHNVTEDADLGLRLARRGFRCKFVPTVTEEEATASIKPWVRQRSRWIKGYCVTWCVHMRDPLALLGDLGLKRFIGVQIVFLGSLSQFILAPLLWSFWLILFGVPHPLTTMAPPAAILTLATLFFIAEIATVSIAALSVATPRHGWLIKWVPMMHIYFPLAAFASWKGFAELITRPFYWDKTDHGKTPVTRGLGRLAWRLRQRLA